MDRTGLNEFWGEAFARRRINSYGAGMHQQAELVLELTKSGSMIEHTPLPSDDRMQWRPEFRPVKSSLGWEPSVALCEGLEKTID